MPEFDVAAWRARLGAAPEAARPEILAELWVEARDRLVRRVERRLDGVPIVRQLVGASDVVQDVFPVALRKLPALLADERLDPFAWLVTLTGRKLGDRFKELLDVQERDLRRASALPDGSAAHPPSREPSPSEGARGAEAAAVFNGLMALLSPEDREVIRLARIEWKSNREVAAALGISTDAAAARLSRARKRFWALLQDLTDGEG